MIIKINKINIILLIMILFLCGCSNKNEIKKETSNKSRNCSMKYKYACGYNVLRGKTECSLGYYLVCE